MKYEKRMNLLINTQSDPSKFGTRHQFEMNDELRGTYNKDNQIKFKASMIKSSLCDYYDVQILVNGTITIDGVGADEGNKGLIYENCGPFTECIGDISNTQIDNANNMHVVMLTYNLIEYSYYYSKKFMAILQR